MKDLEILTVLWTVVVAGGWALLLWIVFLELKYSRVLSEFFAELRLRAARAKFWLVQVPALALAAALQRQSWPHTKNVLGHTVDVIRAVWKRRREFAALGVFPWHALQAALLHDLGKPATAQRRRRRGVRGKGHHPWSFPDHEQWIATRIVGMVHPDVWWIVRFHHLPISRWEWDDPRALARALYGQGLDLRWGRILALFAECDGEGLAEDFLPQNVQQFKEALDVLDRTAFTTCRVCGGWAPAFPKETQWGSDLRAACCECE